MDSTKANPNIREMTLNALLMINEEGIHSSSVINDALGKYSRLDPRDKALFVKLIHGTLEYQIQLDSIIDRYSNIKIKKMKPLVRNILRMSLYQIIYMDKIPDSAVCDEAVKLIKNTAMRNLSGFINGVLRNIARDKSEIRLNGPEEKFSVQEWMYQLLCDTVGSDNTDAYLEYSLKEHGITIRQIGTDNLKLIENVGNIEELDGWKEGHIIVQDISASMPVRLADINNGDIVIDVCAAPGGKTIQASEKVGNTGTVYSCDLTQKKVTKIEENLNRLKINNVITLVQDATLQKDDFIETADVVLADLPCSGIGTISKKPEIKNRLSIDDCMSLAEIQKKILDNVSNYVKTGGKLVYSTCTLDHFENEDNTKYFLEQHSNFELITERTLLPGDIPQDGFYIAIFKKNG